MSQIIFEINYDVIPEKREEYLSNVKELRELIRGNSGKNYDVYENKRGSNNFSEIYLCESEEEYENLEDNNDENVMELTEKLFTEFITDKKVKYTTRYSI